ncbi:SPOC domain / Transcription elongation factor S-II protein [Artemisia annua]|uniref:SPOC domain / Transcription elongation factor S-II protein n=1 Tax=Artemisia annua TaxID=35608 RepID=A0A2U1KK63_ARTAN|nr:SPOC domain / Transcription elongation factor S-II protein [Artemisia annua]
MEPTTSLLPTKRKPPPFDLDNKQTFHHTKTSPHTTTPQSLRSKLTETLAAALSVATHTALDKSTDNNLQQAQEKSHVLPDGGDTFLVKDELLQGNGLSWAWDADVTQQGDIPQNSNTPQVLASRIEAELFKLFGGVNKKYKEKGRSLMFNLKDPNNPELRDKILSGVILPHRLCSMTPEELASKQLSEWRMAKAEEHDKMIVLPDSDVDVRRLVKKTHKGEYQVEVEKDDGVSDESSSLAISADGTDFMQELIVDDTKDEGLLPPVVSLDEFMESLNSEPPFENVPVDSKATKPVNSEAGAEIDSEKILSGPASVDPLGADQPKAKTMEALLTKKTSQTSLERKIMPAIGTSLTMGERIWEGDLQLTISSSVSAIGLFRSGEKTSTKEWPGSMEIKGRVRLDAFEKFLQELPMSRHRAVMILHFVLKDPSSEIHRAILSEAMDPYIGDERLGFGEPNPGVELYFCPPHTKVVEMLCRHLSKNQTDILKPSDNGLIGVVVWRRPHINLSNQSTSSQHRRHIKHSFPTKRHEDMNTITNLNFTAKPRVIQQPTNDNDDDGDIPPGFGPGAATASRDEDDLPEFNFAGNSSSSGAQVLLGSKPVDEMRELIKKYGQTENQDEEDDDMPEWQPQLTQNLQQPYMVDRIRPRPHMNIQPPVNVLQNVGRWAEPLPANESIQGHGQWGPRPTSRSRGF